MSHTRPGAGFFYMNLPIGGLALLLLFAFLQVSYKKESTLMEKLKRIDFVGNTLLIASVVSILMALTYGGTRYSLVILANYSSPWLSVSSEW